jgi:hypothetical protein
MKPFLLAILISIAIAALCVYWPFHGFYFDMRLPMITGGGAVVLGGFIFVGLGAKVVWGASAMNRNVV